MRKSHTQTGRTIEELEAVLRAKDAELVVERMRTRNREHMIESYKACTDEATQERAVAHFMLFSDLRLEARASALQQPRPGLHLPSPPQ